MPSPIGHALAGATIAWAIAPARPKNPHALWNIPLVSPLSIACAALAAAPDLDLLLPAAHRTVTHSVAAVAAVGIVSFAVTGKVTARGRIVMACILAYASHLFLDYLSVDPTPPRGLQLLWPLGDQWFISGLDIFRGTARRNIFSRQSMWINVTAIVQELAILGPLAVTVLSVRGMRFGRGRSSETPSGC